MTINTQRCDCGSANVTRINPLAKIAMLQCNQCKSFFIPWDDRRKVCIRIGEEHPGLQLFETGGVINERVFRFWAKTDPKGTAAKILDFIQSQDPEFFRRMTPCTTIDRDFRRKMLDNNDGLNRTYRKEAEKRKPTGLEVLMQK